MIQRWQVDDFRAARRLLDPEVFLNGSNPPPTDLVDEQIWDGIMHLPDHVSITTSNHHGRLLKKLYEVWGGWIKVVDGTQDQLYDPILDACDEFQNTIFSSLHGYYRPAIASLRNALELIVVGTYTQVCGKPSEFTDWRAGQVEIAFGKACDELHRAATVQALNTYLRRTIDDTLFEQKTKSTSGGWARRLYSDLSNFSHTRPTFSNADIWQSNGPIYVHEAFELTAERYLETSALCLVAVKLARPTFVLPAEVEQVFDTTGTQ